jgi:adenylate kinase family enzyme
MKKLIIIRGNSGSGKSTLAKKLRAKMGDGTMLISQDTVRREILKVKDVPGNPSTQLIYDLGMYGKKIGYNIIIEGILSSERGGEMLRKLIKDFEGESYVYYFDIPFDETLRRHNSKPNHDEFGEKEMREWWKEKDYLGIEGEQIIAEDMDENEIVRLMEEQYEN